MDLLHTTANYIWAKDNQPKNQHCMFYKKIVLDSVPSRAEAVISVDTKYWLWLNGKQVVFEGGLFRESMPGCGYGDIVNLAPFLKKGENILAVNVWYYGNEGRNNNNSKNAYFLFECKELDILSDSSFKCINHPAFYEVGEPYPAYLYGGFNIGYNESQNREDIYNPRDYDSLPNATVYTDILNEGLYARCIPLIKKYDYTDCTPNKTDKGYIISFSHASAALISFEIIAKKGTILNIVTDRYMINGGPSDEIHQYAGHRIEYICKEGKNSFTSDFYLYGEQFIVETSELITVLKMGYIETGYDCEIIGKFNCSCEITNKLVKKAARTLYVCMRDNFMDCPDRERGQWIGDVAVQSPQVFFLLSDSAKQLLKKCIHDFINLRKGDTLVGLVPGACYCELPGQSLIAIGEYGIISTYYKYTGETDVLSFSFEPIIRYLMLWEMKDGLVAHREGNYGWFDHLYNVDVEVLENGWYYSALTFAKRCSEILKDNRFDEFLDSRINQIKENYNRKYWKNDYYSSGSVVDDRANAVAVLSGLCLEENYDKIKRLLLKVFNSSIFMESYVLEALCKMGYIKDAYHRMVSRYYNLAVNNNSTLWEDFFILGTKNHAWSGAPATIAFKYFMGIDTKDGFETYTVNPVKDLYDHIECELEIKGKKVSFQY